jgi:phosphopentomutase
VIPLEELYDICEKVRTLTLDEKYKVGRIIARPYLGNEKDGYERTANRHDYALSPTSKTVLNVLEENGFDVISVGKIRDIFNGSGITDHYGIKSNHDGMEKVKMLVDKDFTGLNFTNLVDFDAKYGHRRNPEGYKMAMEEFDHDLGELIQKLSDDDLLMVTADHGNDPTHHGTDHTREYVPLFIYNHQLKGQFLETSKTFADIGETIADNFGLKGTDIGESLLSQLK